jgi:cation diffusion facilitator family transporter
MKNPARYAKLSVAASLVTLTLKFGAWALTGSVGLLSDATESVVNLAAGLMALVAITIAAKPSDSRHSYGHGKAEFFSSGAEGLLILLAAAGIVYASLERFGSPAPLTHLEWGLGVALVASGVNLLVARIILQAAKEYDSITLEADAKHLLTDVWTSAGMVAGLGVLIFAPPSWQVLDPAIACLMAANIVWTGVSLIRQSVAGLMDTGLSPQELAKLNAIIASSAGVSVSYHALRTRKSGANRFIDFALLVTGTLSVREAHDLCCRIEDGIEEALPRSSVTIHIEPLEESVLPQQHAV